MALGGVVSGGMEEAGNRDLSCSEVFLGIGMLIIEGRVPGLTKRGYGEGPHISILNPPNKHICDTNTLLCKRKEKFESYMLLLWENAVSMCVEVLLAPDCQHGKQKAHNVEPSVQPDESYILLEQWTVQMTTRTPDAVMTDRSLLLALRSYLHFSQLSAWYSQYKGSRPANVLFRITVPGEQFASSFPDWASPVCHQFPLATVGKKDAIKVSVKALPRREDIPIVICTQQEEGAEATTCDGPLEAFQCKGMAEDRRQGCGQTSKPICQLTGKHMCSQRRVDEYPLPKIADPDCGRRVKKKLSEQDDYSMSSSEMEDVLRSLRERQPCSSGKSSPRERSPVTTVKMSPTNDSYVDTFLRRRYSISKTVPGSSSSDSTEEITNKFQDLCQPESSCSRNTRNNQKFNQMFGENPLLRSLGVTIPQKRQENYHPFQQSIYHGFLNNNKDEKSNANWSDEDMSPPLCGVLPKTSQEINNNTQETHNCKCPKLGAKQKKEKGFLSHLVKPRQPADESFIKSGEQWTCKRKGDKTPSKREEKTSRGDKTPSVILLKSDMSEETTAIEESANKDTDKEDRHKNWEGNRPVPPSPTAAAEFRRYLDSAASMVFHQRTRLPLTSSPAPLRRGKAFTYDSSLNSPLAIKSALFETQNENGEEEEDSHCGFTSSCLLGNFEESVLNGRLEPASTVPGFTAEIGAFGSFQPSHITLPVTVFFYTLCESQQLSSPYLAHINLGKKAYKVPSRGTIQVTLFNPHRTVVKMWVVSYDLSDMPPMCQTFIRQRTLYMPVGSSDRHPDAHQWLRYLIHLRFHTSKSNKLYLHTDIRMIIFRKSDVDTATLHRGALPYELRSFTHRPDNPKYSPRR